MEMFSVEFMSSLLSIIMIDIVLGGDNAILIALATRNLPLSQRKRAIFWGVFGAIAIRAGLTVVAVKLLEIKFLHLIGGILLVWIAYKLLVDEEQHSDIKSGQNIFDAVRTIVIADLLMGIDNVLAVAGAAHGSALLVVMGLIISIPIIVWGSSIILRFIEKYPVIIFIGAGVIAWTAGKMIVEDDFIYQNIISKMHLLKYIIPLIITLLVVLLGFRKRKANNHIA